MNEIDGKIIGEEVKDSDYLKNLKGMAQFLIKYRRLFYDGMVLGFKTCYTDNPCAECSMVEKCGASLTLLCMFADDQNEIDCIKQGSFFHQITLYELKK